MHPASAGSEHARVGPALEALSLGEVFGSPFPEPGWVVAPPGASPRSRRPTQTCVRCRTGISSATFTGPTWRGTQGRSSSRIALPRPGWR